MIMQSPGIDYNSLLNKCAANYSNVNSARAAMSRALKDLDVVGLLKRQGNSFFATDKAVVLARAEMKNKLVLKLNELVNSKNPHLDLDQIVSSLSTLIERSKHDARLLMAAKGAVDFSIGDLKRLRKRHEQLVSHLEYMDSVLKNQIKTLCQLDFSDVRKTGIEIAGGLMVKIVQKNRLKEFAIETNDEGVAKKIGQEIGLRFKKKSVTVKVQFAPKIFGLFENLKTHEKNSLVFFFPPVRVNFNDGVAFFSGPYSIVSSL
ncbi:MAG: hypothetical protein HYW50_03885 [Candidatus Diapherotrites archaeon]|nr:hypothetical protein [Candidatus Diapherotrites archaeon]